MESIRKNQKANTQPKGSRNEKCPAALCFRLVIAAITQELPNERQALDLFEKTDELSNEDFGALPVGRVSDTVQEPERCAEELGGERRLLRD